MNIKRATHLCQKVLVGSVLLALPFLSNAGAPDPSHGGDCNSHGPPHPPGPPPMGGGFGAFDGDHDGRPPFLMGMKLTEDQQDKIFNIMHAASPALRDQSKALHRAHDALYDLTRSAQFTNELAMTLAQAQGKAETQMAFLRTKLEHDIYAVLTSDQQAEVAKHHQEMEAHHGEGPPHH